MKIGVDEAINFKKPLYDSNVMYTNMQWESKFEIYSIFPK